MERIYIRILVISSLCIKLILSCNIHVCLTWEAKKENITFKCKVSQLRWEVKFLNPLKEEQGYCGMPVPVPGCHSSHNTISQDRKTNTTILIIQRHVDSTLNGPWKCSHGTNIDEAIINVTVIKEDIFKTIFRNNNCGEQHMAWTFIGVMIGVVIVFIMTTVFKTYDWNITTRGYTRESLCRNCCIFSQKSYYAAKLSTVIFLSFFVIIIPYVSGLLENSCKDKEYFIIFGMCMVFMFILCLWIPRTGQQNKPPADLETSIKQCLNREKESAEKNKSGEEE